MIHHRTARRFFRLAGSLLLLAALAHPAVAESGEVRIAQQFGVSYLPLTIMNHEKLLEAAAAEKGIAGLKISWNQFGAGNAMNEALLSGNLDLASGGVGPLLTIWSKTKGRQDIRAVAALNSMPLYLNVIDPNIRSLKDLTGKERIAMPTVKISIQAVTLQMATEQVFGHFGSAPFQYQELEDKRVHRLLSSYEVLGGPATFNVVWTQKKFHDDNPKIYAAFLSALEQAIALINSDPSRAAAIYLDAEKSKLPAAFVEQMIRDPENVFTTVPQNIMKYAAFMNRTGAIENRPAAWTDLFFPEIHAASGS
jgi:NitT/TauT family transport system substrate-binding protein